MDHLAELKREIERTTNRIYRRFRLLAFSLFIAIVAYIFYIVCLFWDRLIVLMETIAR